MIKEIFYLTHVVLSTKISIPMTIKYDYNYFSQKKKKKSMIITLIFFFFFGEKIITLSRSKDHEVESDKHLMVNLCT